MRAIARGIGFGPRTPVGAHRRRHDLERRRHGPRRGGDGSQYEISASGEPSSGLDPPPRHRARRPGRSGADGPHHRLVPAHGRGRRLDRSNPRRRRGGVARGRQGETRGTPWRCTADGDLAEYAPNGATEKNRMGTMGRVAPPAAGCVGCRALLLRSQERVVLEKGMLWVIETLRAGGTLRRVKPTCKTVGRSDDGGFAWFGAADSVDSVRFRGVPSQTWTEGRRRGWTRRTRSRRARTTRTRGSGRTCSASPTRASARTSSDSSLTRLSAVLTFLWFLYLLVVAPR